MIIWRSSRPSARAGVGGRVRPGAVAQQSSGDGDRHRARTRRDDDWHAKAAKRVCSSLFRRALLWMRRTTPTSPCCSSSSARRTSTRYLPRRTRSLAKEKPTTWTLKAFKYYYIPSPPIGLAGIVVEPTEDLHRLQDELIKAVKPYTVKTGTPAAFFSEEGGRNIQEYLISYVANFVRDAAGKRFNPHVTIGVGTETYLERRCWRSRFRRSRSRRRARRSISLAALARLGRNSRR